MLVSENLRNALVLSDLRKIRFRPRNREAGLKTEIKNRCHKRHKRHKVVIRVYSLMPAGRFAPHPRPAFIWRSIISSQRCAFGNLPRMAGMRDRWHPPSAGSETDGGGGKLAWTRRRPACSRAAPHPKSHPGPTAPPFVQIRAIRGPNLPEILSPHLFPPRPPRLCVRSSPSRGGAEMAENKMRVRRCPASCITAPSSSIRPFLVLRRNEPDLSLLKLSDGAQWSGETSSARPRVRRYVCRGAARCIGAPDLLRHLLRHCFQEGIASL